VTLYVCFLCVGLCMFCFKLSVVILLLFWCVYVVDFVMILFDNCVFSNVCLIEYVDFLMCVCVCAVLYFCVCLCSGFVISGCVCMFCVL